MNKKTTTDLRNEIDRKIDVNGNLISDPLLIDFANDAQDDMLQLLIEMHKEGLIAVEWSRDLLKFGTFNYRNEITLPNDYLVWISCNFENDTGSPVVIVRDEDVLSDDWVGENVCAVTASNITTALANTSNSGSDNFEARGKFTGTTDTVYQFEIEAGGATFKWTNDGGSSYTSGVSCADTWIDIENGVRVNFGGSSGFTAGDIWDISAYASKERAILRVNFDPSVNLDFYFVTAPAQLTVVDPAAYIPYPQFWRAFRYLVEIRVRAYNEERMDVDAAVNSKTIKRARELIRDYNSPKTIKYQPKYGPKRGYL